MHTSDLRGGGFKHPLLFLVTTVALFAQGDSGLQQGRALFRSNCAFCHGMTATGGRGPNLVSAPLTHGEADDSIKRVIQIGVPGTTMPAFSDFTPDELGHIVEYLRSLQKGTVRREHVPGDAALGKRVYESNGCGGCHRIGGLGSVFGPDLNRIGAARPVEYLRESVVHPSADIPEAFQGVTVITKAGQKIQGIRINEDTFSLQLRDMAQKTRMFSKEELRSVTYETKSLMPAYSSLSESDVQNLVAYLATLRGNPEASATTKKAEGIK
ncbi:MAG: c-type cytochrome [Acidobacteriota bacterium]|nr:c-type cytochrome [Acidobacteriota bacterium]